MTTGRVDRINRNARDLGLRILVLSGRHVAAATLDGQLDLQLALLVEGGKVQIGVVDLHAGGRRDVAGENLAGASLPQVHDDRLVVLAGQDDLLDVQDDLSDIFLHTFDRAELVGDAINTDGRHRCTRNRGQEGTTQGVTQRVAEPGLEGLQGETGAQVADLFFGQDGSLCNEHVYSFLTGARYMTPDVGTCVSRLRECEREGSDVGRDTPSRPQVSRGGASAGGCR